MSQISFRWLKDIFKTLMLLFTHSSMEDILLNLIKLLICNWYFGRRTKTLRTLKILELTSTISPIFKFVNKFIISVIECSTIITWLLNSIFLFLYIIILCAPQLISHTILITLSSSQLLLLNIFIIHIVLFLVWIVPFISWSILHQLTLVLYTYWFLLNWLIISHGWFSFFNNCKGGVSTSNSSILISRNIRNYSFSSTFSVSLRWSNSRIIIVMYNVIWRLTFKMLKLILVMFNHYNLIFCNILVLLRLRWSW